MPKKIQISEMTVRSLVGAGSPEDSIYYATRPYYKYDLVSAMVQPFGTDPAEQRRLTEVLRNHEDVEEDVIHGAGLYLVTLKLSLSVELSDADATYVNTGVDQERRVQMASCSEAESGGGTDPRFRGPPTEA